MSTQPQIVPTILCGGAGSRLWPVSRESHPKPFIRLEDGESLLQKAFKRGAGLPGVTEVVTVTNRELYFKTNDEFGPVNTGHLSTSFILEPFGRNTAVAIAAAALRVAATHGENAVLLVLPADHLVTDDAAFGTAVQEAAALALKGALVTFGITPTFPETAYGYIEADGTRVKRFVEKPTADVARQYVESGSFLWNSGMFCFTAAFLLAEMAKHCPDVLEATRACISQSRQSEGGGVSLVELNGDLLNRAPDISIDYALMERSDKVSVVRCNIGWSDIGSWNALGDLSKPDDHGNRVDGEALLHDVSNCYIRSDNRLVGAVGVKDLLVVDTPDALLIADRNRAQDVRHVYATLKSQGHETFRVHRTVSRPWGMYTVLEESTRFKIKRIEVKPGASLSLQLHHHRSEHWIVVSGMALVVNNDEEFYLRTNESAYIPAGHKHRLTNPGVVDLVMIEVQSGDYLGEDDIVRFDDNYGRS
ncbi:mannose-1-phosphate guanyltransferase [Burkholderia ubonensis]|uniref:mannose-1-phosphate guanylyltransferase/mannose-6-phosphate isomerase n=1 Tax=Burkholderia ubonensis TaxID=101571 RepID=UPI0007562A00|nr:mannose-1-phosphate guanylyltransferase/mannose-6-phosphate isomerase [Burkholderia ubonensis]KVP00160.1 mannose-1-phosphate guanyltransferase [Burkholderia ubonensis]KVZ69609.1 mannose-1-phosphate guanyltransferase [Burkholderia ubonensis]KVZ71443.1 mannose-1-phosphate guanyltransferase [Burkholderia ubonensis]KWB47393.1 mannose-1-phosphate guanyltransferase [Burkholderia ubonensis]